MELSLKESLRKLERLSPAKLNETSRRIRSDLAGAEWKMGVCLLAAVRRKSFRTLGYATISEYAEKALHLSGQKTGRLLSVAGALEHLPLLSEAFRTGKLGWGKLRAFNGLVTPETEAEWLKFALTHSTAEVVNKVALSPSAWKKYGALKASLEDKPIATAREVASLLNSPSQTVSAQSPVPNPPLGNRAEANSSEEPTVEKLVTTGSKDPNSPPGDSRGTEGPDFPSSKEGGESPTPKLAPMPGAPQKIRLVIELTPDQYALFERAESRARARAQKRVSRAEVMTALAQSFLEAGTARSRAKHQVLVHTDLQTGEAWYDTERGPLPVDPKVLEQAQREREPLVISKGRIVELRPDKMTPKVEPFPPKASESTSPARLSKGSQPLSEQPRQARHIVENTTAKGRSAIPNNTLRLLQALACQACQRCGDRKGPFEAHHSKPLSEGGTHELSTLKLLCRACHSLVHEPDFAGKPQWAAAKAANVRKGLARGRPQPTS